MVYKSVRLNLLYWKISLFISVPVSMTLGACGHMGLSILPLHHMTYIDPAGRPMHHKLSGMATTRVCFFILFRSGRWRFAPLQKPSTDTGSTFCRRSQQMGIWQLLSSHARSVGRSSSQGHCYFVSIFPIHFHAVCRFDIKMYALPAHLLGDLTGL